MLQTVSGLSTIFWPNDVCVTRVSAGLAPTGNKDWRSRPKHNNILKSGNEISLTSFNQTIKMSCGSAGRLAPLLPSARVTHSCANRNACDDSLRTRLYHTGFLLVPAESSVASQSHHSRGAHVQQIIFDLSVLTGISSSCQESITGGGVEKRQWG